MRRVSDCRGGEDASARSDEQSFLWCPILGEALQNGAERLQDRYVSDVAPIGLLGDQPSDSRVRLATDGHDVGVPVDVSDLEPCYLAAAGGQECAQHDEVGVALVDLAAGVGEGVESF